MPQVLSILVFIFTFYLMTDFSFWKVLIIVFSSVVMSIMSSAFISLILFPKSKSVVLNAIIFFIMLFYTLNKFSGISFWKILCAIIIASIVSFILSNVIYLLLKKE